MEIVVVVIVVLVALLLVAGLLFWQRKQQSKRLQGRFGPEYDRALEERGDRRAAERDLAQREERRQELEIKPLDAVRQQQYANTWQQVQGKFVDHPVEAVSAADRLVREVMAERGYPIDEDFERQAGTVSVDHPEVVGDYRAAHRISVASDEGRATTEELREAMVHYRSLFSRLLEDRRPTGPEGRS